MRAIGHCLCKSVKFSFEFKNKHFGACHCSMCRAWGGGPGLGVEASGGVEFEGQENITVYNSSDWAERGFCKKCGSNLFYRLKNQGIYNFNLGTIENHKGFRFMTQIYVDVKPNNYSFSNETKMMTEKEVLEVYGALE